ncbi:hypothetical protein [Puia dinghuensis]|uniref:Uncharacterized protein n=1 Tax=Puia dinghuensis TaxID=1792502 RepID=A0A8J2UHM8_9BACT|nr:hypothetical protein [Puia dinghuensis]GGB19308.1 hypothetical protein GCM10011511_48740 [Puia dinghuensis]
MPGFKKHRIYFRPLQLSDAIYISQWLADALRQPPGWERRLRRLLKEEWQKTDKLSRQMSWMCMSGNDPLFFLEIAGADEVFLTAPRGVLNNRPAALAAWRRVIVHLRSLRVNGRRTLSGIHVKLENSRHIECECLLQLGFTEIPHSEAPNGTLNHRSFQLTW